MKSTLETIEYDQEILQSKPDQTKVLTPRERTQTHINYLFSTAHRVVENICPYGLSNTKPVERVSQYRFTVRLKWVKSTVSVESRVFGLNLWGGGKYFGMFSYS